MWKKGKTKIIQNSIVTYKHAHTQAHTPRHSLPNTMLCLSLSPPLPPGRHCARSALLSLSLSSERKMQHRSAGVR